MNNRPTPPVHNLTKWKEVRAMAAPLRMRILDALRDTPLTTKQVALQLNEPPTKLYRHVQLLEDAGLVKLQFRRKKRGTIEKYYRATAAEFIIDRKLLESRSRGRGATRGYEALFLGAIRATLLDVQESIAAKLIRPVAEGRNALAFRCCLRGSEAQMTRRMKKVWSWIRQCQAMRGRPGGAAYGITIAFYPLKTDSSEKDR